MTALVIGPLVDIDTVIFRPVLNTASTIPDLPTFPNPGRFKSLDFWTDKQRSIEKIEHDQRMEEFIITQHVDKALVMLFKEVFNESTWSDLNKGAFIGKIIESNALGNLHTVRQTHKHLERKFNKERPLDVDAV